MAGNISCCLVSKMAFHNKDYFYRSVTLQRSTKRKYSTSIQTVRTRSIWPDAFLNMTAMIIQNLRPNASETILKPQSTFIRQARVQRVGHCLRDVSFWPLGWEWRPLSTLPLNLGKQPQSLTSLPLCILVKAEGCQLCTDTALCLSIPHMLGPNDKNTLTVQEDALERASDQKLQHGSLGPLTLITADHSSLGEENSYPVI